MPELPQVVESTFRHILIAAKRAEQLIAGARPRITGRNVKPTTIALAELAAEKVPWRAVTAEEYEAILLQEAAAREAEEHIPALIVTPPPVLPPIVEPEALVEEDEDEDEEDLDEELEGPKFDENLEVVEEAVAEELLTEELPAEE